jgi:hypothetical protein
MQTVFLTGDDLKILSPIFEEKGWSPLPISSVAIVMMDDKGVAGFHALQVVAHPEPLWVRPDMEGTGLAADLAGEMNDFLDSTNTNRIMCIADSPHAAKLCESLGMKLVSSPVYIRS